MDEAHFLAALRYVALNPVRARLVDRPQDWKWSSTRMLLAGKSDGVTDIDALAEVAPRFADLLALGPDEAAFERLRKAETIGRPLGDAAFLRRAERITEMSLKPGKRGPRPGPRRASKPAAR